MTEYATRSYPVPPEDLSLQLDKFGKLTRTQRNEILYEAGTEANSLYIVRKGIVFSRRKNEKDGRSFIDQVAHPGQFLGIESIGEEPEYGAHAISANNAEVLNVPAETVESLVAEYPFYFMQLLTHRIRDLESFQERLRLPTAERVLFSIEEFRNGRDLVSVDQSVVAERAGASRGSVIYALSKAGKVWEEIVDPSLQNVSNETSNKIERLVRKYLKSPKKNNTVVSQITFESGSSDKVVRWVMDKIHVLDSDFNLTLAEVTKLRVQRAIDNCRDSQGMVDVPRVHVANVLGLSVGTVTRVVQDLGLDWNTLIGKDPLMQTERVLTVIEDLKDENGKIRVTRQELMRLAGVSHRKLRKVFEECGLNWGDLTYRKSKKSISPEVITKVEEEIAALKGNAGKVPMTQTEFASRVGLSSGTVTVALNHLGFRWRDIADPSVYIKEKNN